MIIIMQSRKQISAPPSLDFLLKNGDPVLTKSKTPNAKDQLLCKSPRLLFKLAKKPTVPDRVQDILAAKKPSG